METLFAFLLNSSLGIILFYLVYWFFLRHETFYQANRWFLLLALIISVLIPAFPLKYSVIYEPENVAGTIGAITDTFKNVEIADRSNELKSEIFNWKQGLTLIYFTGTAIFLFRLLLQSLILIYMILKLRVRKLGGMRVVENKKYGLPFSFFNIIFINPKFHTQENLPEILAHENVHIREYHWFDLLFIELLTVIFWFNPFIWFFERSMKQNHEYLADKGVISMGHSAARYKALLLNQLMGMQIIGITNNLNFALNTNRLKMMTKKKTPKIKGYKFTFALPALTLLLAAFAEPEYVPVNDNEETTLVQGIQSDKQFIIHGKVVDAETGGPMSGAFIEILGTDIKGTAIGTVSDLDGSFTLVDPNPKSNESGFYSDFVVFFVGFKTEKRTVSSVDKKLELDIPPIQMQRGAIKIEFRRYVEGEKPPPPPPPRAHIKDYSKGTDSNNETFYVIELRSEFFDSLELESRKYVTEEMDKLSKEKDIKGKAKVGFTVNADGNVIDVKILEKDNDLVGKEAARIVAAMPKWTPGKQNDKPVSLNYILPLEFK